MRRFIAATALLVTCCATAIAPAVQAGVYTDDLSKCLVKSANAEDQKDLVVWIFAALSSHPAVRPYSTITSAQQDGFNKRAGGLMQRLLTVDCRPETISAIKYEGSQALEASFSVLGQVAMRGLMADPAVNKGIASISEGIDNEKLDALGREAGLAGEKPK